MTFTINRRHFVRAALGTLALGSLGACASVTSRAPALDLAQFHRERRTRITPQGTISYLDRGRGPVALFLHGFPLNGFQWRGAIERLADVRRCIAPDFLALGYTEVAEGADVSPEGQLAMIEALLAALDIHAVDLIANDSGGAIAQLFLARHPERVRSLLLTNCDVETDSPPPALLPVIDLSKQGRFVDDWLVPWHGDHALARSPEGIGGMCYSVPGHPTDEALDAYFTPIVASARSKALMHAYAIALERNALAGIEPTLRANRAPVGVVWGMGDTIFSKDSPDYLARVMGGLRWVRRLPEAKLFWPEEHPDIVGQAARDLWASYA